MWFLPAPVLEWRPPVKDPILKRIPASPFIVASAATIWWHSELSFSVAVVLLCLAVLAATPRTPRPNPSNTERLAAVAALGLWVVALLLIGDWLIYPLYAYLVAWSLWKVDRPLFHTSPEAEAR
jgi:hypothetical protein